MRVRMLVVGMFVLAIMGPPIWAGDAFWHGGDVDEAGPDPTFPYPPGISGNPLVGDRVQQEELHRVLVEDCFPQGFNPMGQHLVNMPLGDMIYTWGPKQPPLAVHPGPPWGYEKRGVRIHKPSKCWSGYTLINSNPTSGTAKNGNNILIDMKGNIVNEWTFPPYGGVGSANTSGKLLPGGYLVGSTRGPSGLSVGALRQLDWNSNVVHTWPGLLVHHDHQREGSSCGYAAPYQNFKVFNGKTLTLEFHYPSAGDAGTIDTSGWFPNVPIIDDVVREIAWDGTELFRWEAFRYIGKMKFDDAAKDAMTRGLNVLPGVIDGPPGPPQMTLREDWCHGNAVAWLGWNKWWYQHNDGRFHPENIIMDFRSLNITLIIARHDNRYGKWKQGDIVWQIGPDYSTAGEDGKIGQIIGQHMAHMIPMYMPGEGNILILDNGGTAGYGALIQGLTAVDGTKLGHFPNKQRHFSRVLEINPVTKQIVWEYKNPIRTKDRNRDGIAAGNERRFYSCIMSGCQRLMNGNTLITEADTGRIFEVTKSGEVVWEFVLSWANPIYGNPAFGMPPNIPGPPAPSARLRKSACYRAYRVPYWWIPQHLLCKKGP